MLNILSLFFRTWLHCHQGRIIFHLLACLPLPYITLFQIGSIFEENWTENRMWFLIFKNVCMKHFLFQEELTRYYEKRKYAFYKISDLLVAFQRNFIFLHRLLRNIQILNFMKIWREIQVVSIIKTDIAEKIHFVIFQTRLKSWVGSLVSFLRLCMNILSLTFN